MRLEDTHLSLSFVCELDPMIRDHLVDVSVLVALALGVSDQDDHLYLISSIRIEACDRGANLLLVYPS